MTHIAISHTPFHLLQLGVVASGLKATGDSLTIFHEGAVDPRIPGLADTEIVELPRYTGNSGRMTASKNIATILAHPSFQREAVLYISDLRWLTNNGIYFSMPREYRRHAVMFADGLASYLERGDLVRTTGTSIAKWGMGVVGKGPRHVPLRGNYLGLDRRYISKAIGFRADLMCGDAAKEDLAVTTGPNSGEAKGTLVVGAPLDAHRYTPQAAAAIIAKTAAAAQERSATDARLLYKPHHFEDPWVAEQYQERGFQLVSDDRPVELLTDELGVSRMFGAYSGALAFSPYLSGGKVKTYSVCFDEFSDGYLNRVDRARLHEVLVRFGVEFL